MRSSAAILLVMHFMCLGLLAFAQRVDVPVLYTGGEGRCTGDSLFKYMDAKGNIIASAKHKAEMDWVQKNCKANGTMRKEAISQTPTSQPMGSADDASSERSSAWGTTGSNCCERWVTTDPNGGGTWGYVPVGKDGKCTLADSPFRSIGIATSADQIFGVCFVVGRTEERAFNIMTCGSAASTWCGTDVDNTSKYSFGMVLLSEDDVKIALPGKAPKPLVGFKGSDFIDRLDKEKNGQTSDFLAKVAMVFAYDPSAEMITNPKADRCAVWSGNNYYGIASGGAVQPLVCLGGDGLSQPSLAMAEVLHRTKSKTMQTVCDLFVSGIDKAYVTGAFSGQPTPKPDITRPDMAWAGLLGECNGPNCTLICADGSCHGPTANFTNNAEWWSKVSSLNSPHLAILAAVDPGAQVVPGNRNLVLVVTSNADDVYQVTLNSDTAVVKSLLYTAAGIESACDDCKGLDDSIKITLLNQARARKWQGDDMSAEWKFVDPIKYVR